MKIALAFAAHRRHLVDHSVGLLPLGLLSMAACLRREGHEVSVAHLGQYRRKDAVALLREMGTDLVGLSCFTFHRHETLELARDLRKASGARIVLGGPHAAPLAPQILEHSAAVDAVACGEGERTMVELAARLQRGEPLAGTPGLVAREGGHIVEGPAVPLLEDLDELPTSSEMTFPILGLSVPYQLRHLTASRGCAAACIFCRAPNAWGRRVRRRTVASFLAEVATLRRERGLVFLSFRDDTFTADRAWVQELCRGLIEQGSDVHWDCQTRVSELDAETADLMRRAGCVQVQVGLESGSPRMLRTLRKPFSLEQAHRAVQACRAAGLLVSMYLIYGVPGEEEEDIRQTEQFVRECRPASLSVAHLCKYPGTALAADVEAERWFREPGDDLHVRLDAPALRHGERLRSLEASLRGRECYTVTELEAVAKRLRAPSCATALAELHERAGRLDAAEARWRELLQEWPGYLWGEMGLGELLLERGKASEAEPHLRSARHQAPRWPHAVDRLGWCLVAQGRSGEGQALIQEAMALDPGTPPPAPPQRR